jgi:hypothetical protein
MVGSSGHDILSQRHMGGVLTCSSGHATREYTLYTKRKWCWQVRRQAPCMCSPLGPISARRSTTSGDALLPQFRGIHRNPNPMLYMHIFALLHCVYSIYYTNVLW